MRDLVLPAAGSALPFGRLRGGGRLVLEGLIEQGRFLAEAEGRDGGDELGRIDGVLDPCRANSEGGERWTGLA